MKAVPFLAEVRKVIPIEFHRLQRQAVGLRTLKLFPDGRDHKTDITHINSAHLIRVMVLDLNPFADDFLEKLNEHTQLMDTEANRFINDFAEILENGFFLPSKEGIQSIQRISFSLDRPFVSVTFETDEFEAENISKESGFHINYSLKSKRKTYRTERVYGSPNNEVRSLERFAILKRRALMDLSLIHACDEMLISDRELK
jgi:hypothetical protein